MNTREQFGKYLLLKKLTEDALGETFRAGMLGEGGMERVVLLRVFNGQGVDGQRLWQATKDRAEISTQLRNPNLGDGVEMGEIQSLPYVAYDYISGKNMADLLEQAAKSRNYIPAEHALLITERVALALAAASESRLRGERILHGFLTPHLVMISNEGEARLLGFEVGPGLRSFAANPVIRQHFGRYLAPEALHGQPPHSADDIYSLGVLLYELLTSRPLPPPAQDGFATIVAQGLVATEGTPIPAELQDLLKRSLVPREHRIADVGTWHKALNKLMFEGQYNPTTFNLAFFMHNLFRQDIERESQELEVEKTLPLPTLQQAASTETRPLELRDEGTGTGVRDATGTGTGVREGTHATAMPPEAHDAPAKSKTGLIAVAAIVLLAVLGGGGYWLWSQQQAGGDQTASQRTPVAPPTAPPEPPPPAGPSEDELNAKIQELITKQADAMEDEIRKDYERQLSQLQNQLDQSKREAAERLKREQEELERLAREEEEARQAELAAQQKAAAEKAAAEKAAAEKAAAEKAAEEEARVAEMTPPPPVAPPPPPPKPQVRRGDLVELGPGVVAPELVRRPAPRFPEQARRLARKDAKVLIKVLIDENGRVTKAELVGEKQGYGFDTEALNAARRSVYKPATKDGVPVKIWQTLAVEFRAD
jgi:TonB family protein